jgi:phage terminase Nu1 subunit (DNA packaging protein)
MTDKKLKSRGASADELAKLWRCSARQVRKLAEAGIAVRISRGLFDADQSTSNYVDHLRELAAGRGNPEVAAANARLKAAQAELLELKLQKERDELLDREDVRKVWASIIVANRAMVLGIPNAFHFEEPSLTTHAKGTLDRICRDRLEDMAMQRGFSVLALAGLCGECGRPVADAPPSQEKQRRNEVGK